MGKIIFVASYKGGVGKTTVSAGISATLASFGKKVLVIDGDFHMRCMDLVLNSESDFIFDALDVLLERCSAEEAIISNCGVEGLNFLPAPLIYDESNALEKSGELLENLKEKYDYIIIDSGADTPGIYESFAGISDEAVIVTFQQATAIRAAEVTASKLSELGMEDFRLIINSYRGKKGKTKTLPDVFDSVNKTGIPLLGVIPYSPDIIENQEKGILPFTRSGAFIKPYEAAFGNIAKRIIGEKISLFTNVHRFALKKRYKKDMPFSQENNITESD